MYCLCSLIGCLPSCWTLDLSLRLLVGRCWPDCILINRESYLDALLELKIFVYQRIDWLWLIESGCSVARAREVLCYRGLCEPNCTSWDLGHEIVCFESIGSLFATTASSPDPR